ncbi:DUF596 domain-containing protein [Xylella fastidiosa]|uniref:DUF596 domain-containing protein n=1 Tax=Xylella fastidiosa TaxID=2371 RepID=UPI000D5448BF|nr:DUF596 domain-containing protein [Xylella fastidiosa]ALR10019.2 hypothetical protein XFFB_06670 [Xylella fastidiosa]WGZ35071.1 DUF596 domain-containing protein [Xylella fastidiosa subsp. pauca]WGZ37346.1 DUF596 domain-containing protein [Xylella fastidiosa subsp. pauca]
MLTQQQLDYIYEDLGRPFHIIWYNIGDLYGISSDQVDPASFDERKKDFLFLIGKLLNEGKLKLGDRKTKLVMEGTIKELVEKFRSCFPASDDEVDLEGAGLWFVIHECPFIAVWVSEAENGEHYENWCF